MYCINCGKQIPDNAKFCQWCGTPVQTENQAVGEQTASSQPTTGNSNTTSERKEEFTGRVYKCPNCGQILDAFTEKCPACGYELRGMQSTGAVHDLEQKLEQIEAQRPVSGKNSLWSPGKTMTRSLFVSDTDEKEINLIKTFPVPNTREDIFEFMILATSNVDVKDYNFFHEASESEKQFNDAWLSKAKQVLQKAKQTLRNPADLEQIQRLYDNTENGIEREKKKNVIEWILLVGWIPILVIILLLLE